MIEQIASAAAAHVSRETFDCLERYVALLLAANRGQNLIARSTEAEVWERHIRDSAQLVRFVTGRGSSWLDLGSGAGLPGLVVAILTDGPVTLVEPRRLRAAFLAEAVATLGLAGRVAVIAARAETVSGRYDMITARALAAIPRILDWTLPLSHAATRWVLPRGRNGKSELAETLRTWQGEFRVEPSLTDPEAVIVLASAVSKRGRE